MTAGMTLDMRAEPIGGWTHARRAAHPTLLGSEQFRRDGRDGTGPGVVLFVFAGGFPSSRAYCVVEVDGEQVTSTRVMFNAEDQTYCNGAIRPIWACMQEPRATPGQ